MSKLSPKITSLEHGVFIVINDIGVLIRGSAGVGKSTLALELLDRGHTLISDDVVQFEVITSPKEKKSSLIIGTAPSMLQNLLAVRDIGVLDVTEIFSEGAICHQHQLDFIVQLDSNPIAIRSDITNLFDRVTILGYKFSSQTIFAHPDRNIALIVETVMKNYILYINAQDAARKLVTRQQQYL